MAIDDKRAKDIIKRLDTLIIQQEDRPEVYSMQRMSRYLDNIDVTTTGILTKLNDVYKVNEEMKEQSQTLFDRLGERWEASTNKMKVTLVNLADIIKTTLDYKGHFDRIQRAYTSVAESVTSGFIRMRRSLDNILSQLIFSSSSMRLIMSKFNVAQRDLKGFLEGGTGSDAPLTVGYISNLYSKIFAFEQAKDMRNRKLSHSRWKSGSRVQRDIAHDVKRIANELVGKDQGWFVKILMAVAGGLLFFGKQLTTLGTGLKGVNLALTGAKLSKLNPLINGLLKGLSGLSAGLGKIFMGGGHAIHAALSKSITEWIWVLVKNTFIGLGRVVTVMLNPAAIVTMLAGYSLYKIFEEEFDHLFSGIKALFANPENRQALLSRIGEWFTNFVGGIGDFFIGLGHSAMDLLPGNLGEEVTSTIRKSIDLLKQSVMTVIGIYDNVIATFMSVPDMFRMLGFALEGIVISMQEMIASAIDSLPGWMTPDSIKDKFDVDKIAAQREDLEARKKEVSDRIDARYETEYIKDTAVAAVDGVKQVASDAADMVSAARDSVGSGIKNLGDLAHEEAARLEEQRLLAAQAAKMEAQEQARLAREANMEALKVKASEKAAYIVESGRNALTNIVDNSSNVTTSAPMRTDSSAKIVGSSGGTTR